MGGLTLLDRARAAGLSVTADGDRLVIKGPRRAEVVARELIEHKAEVLALLAVPAAPIPEPPVEDPAKPPPPPPGLAAPRRTPWGTVVASAPDAPPIEWFGPPPLHWPVLAAERWGPALGDPTPGIINDQPDRDRLRVAPDAADSEAVAAVEPPPIAVVRATVADWPIPWREAWGRCANELAEAGVPPLQDEQQAFVAVMAAIESGAKPPPIVAPPPAPAETAATSKWACRNRFCLHKTGWWASAWGVVNCLNCVPPSFPELVVTQGDETDAPWVDATRTHQVFGADSTPPEANIRNLGETG